MSDPQAAFATALAKFQEDLPRVGKDRTAKIEKKTGGSYSYAFADLADITEAALPLLAKNGLAWSASPTVDGGAFVLRYALIHTEGHREGGDYPLPDPSRFSSQEIGSALTYARRYALTAVTGIAPSGEDDDGAKASDARAADPLPRAPRSPGRTTRHNGDPTGTDDWTTTQTDAMWLDGFRTRLTASTTPAEVRGLVGEAQAVLGEGKLTKDDALQLKKETDARLVELGVAS